MPGAAILSLTIKDAEDLYSLYMPFIRNGGLFIPSADSYQLDSDLFVLLKIRSNSTKLAIAARVIWLTPPKAQGCKLQGFGIQFLEVSGGSRKIIEDLLADRLASNRPTQTL
ncbi:MAG: PilZ domain-containing protein [Proteobacteria bacterium]|nr:PilZ domain-containing protein [Pseudomonadota bacterium]